MIIIPAIDIIDGQPVRLYQGDYGKKEVVGDSVFQLASRFAKEGAAFLHLVDLDGAKAGRRVNDQIITQVASSLSIPVEIGGGIRTMDDIVYYIEHGVERVILGTSAMEDEELLKMPLHDMAVISLSALTVKTVMCTAGDGWKEVRFIILILRNILRRSVCRLSS